MKYLATFLLLFAFAQAQDTTAMHVILRQDSLNSGWYAINDNAHEPVNFLSVTGTSVDIRVNPDLQVSKILSVTAQPDEIFLGEYITGCKVMPNGQVRITVKSYVTFENIIAYRNQSGSFNQVLNTYNTNLDTAPSAVYDTTTGVLNFSHGSKNGENFKFGGYNFFCHLQNVTGVVTLVSATSEQVSWRLTNMHGVPLKFDESGEAFVVSRVDNRQSEKAVNPEFVFGQSANIWVRATYITE